jgi:hypothetical protein
MFLPILYDVFHPFLSMLPIVHVQSIYNLIKPVTTCYMIFVDFPWFFWHCKHQNRSPVNQQKRPVYRTLVWFTDLFQTFHNLNFVSVFDQFCRFSVKPSKPVRSDFHTYADSLPLCTTMEVQLLASSSCFYFWKEEVLLVIFSTV